MAEETDLGQRSASSAADDRQWVKVQKKTFTNWVNDRLKDTDSRVKDLQIDFDDGLTLIKLLQCLVPDKKFPRYTKKPKMDLQKKENLSIAFDFMLKKEKIPLVNIGPVDITEHNLKLILGLVWTLILRYQLGIGHAESQIEEGAPKGPPKKEASGGGGAKKTLLAWVQATLPNIGVTNFHADWNDGRKISALVDRLKPGLIPDHESLDPQNALENTRKAMDLAENHFGIPQVIHPEDLCVKKPDELSVITYVSYYCSTESPGKNALLDWIHSKIPEHSISNFTTDWKNGIAIGCLTDVVSGGTFPDYESMNPQDALENARKAMDFAEANLGIPKTITPEQFTDPKLDPLPMMTYLTNFQYVTPSQEPHMGLTASGLGVSPHGDTAGKQTNFVVRGRIPEWAKLEIQVTGPDGEPVEVSQASPVHNSISCSYIPKKAGPHTVSVRLNGHHIPKSPFSSTHSEPSDAGKCHITLPDENLIVGKKAEITADCKSGGPGQIQVEVEGPGGNIGTAVTEVEPQCYTVNFVPIEAGPHSVSVHWAGKDVSGSPLSCRASDPKKCIATGPGLMGATVNTDASFTVQSENAGPGPLEVKVNGPSGSVPVAVKEEKGTYTCSYMPTEKGQHQVEVKWASIPITGSPFRVVAAVQADASKCLIKDVPSGFLRVGKEYTFVVVTKGAGDGDLRASGRGAALPIKCEVKSKDSESSIVSFSPYEVGVLTIEPTFAEVAIPDSPLTFKVNDPTKCHINAAAFESGTYKAKQPIDFRVSAQFAGEGELKAKVYGPKGEKDADVKEQGDSTYLIHFTPFNLGPHSIDITFDGDQIPNVPVRFFVDREDSGADDVIVTQPAPGKLGVFVVDNNYDYKLNAAGANEGELSASAYGMGSGSKPELAVIDHGGRQFTVGIKAEVPDDYAIKIKWGEDEVPGSPFNIAFAAKPDASRVRVSGPHCTTAAEPVSLECNTSDAGAGSLSATCRGKRAGSVPIELEDKAKKYSVLFNPPQEDIYTLNVLFSDTHVPGSPFKINLLPTDASKVVVTKPSKIALSCRAVFKVDATEAGPGELSAFCQSENSPNLPVEIEKKDSDVEFYDVTITPLTENKYLVYILWDKKEVSGCPFEVNLLPKVYPERVHVTVPWENSVTEPFCIVDASKAGPGKVTAFCTGDKYGTVDSVKIESMEEQGIYKVSFLPLGDDDYYMSVSFDYKSVLGSPFIIPVHPVSEPVLTEPVHSQEVFSEYPFDFGSFEPPPPAEVEEMHLFIGQPLSVNVEPPPADEGAEVSTDITVSARGDQTGPVDIQLVKDPSTNVYLVKFNPSVPDRYVIQLNNNGIPLPESPIVVVYEKPQEVAVIGAPDQAARPMIGEEVTFDVDATGSGLGDLKVTADGPALGENDSPILQVTEDEEQKSLYHIKYVPLAHGRHRIHINWNGEPIADSPISFQVAGSPVPVGEHAYPYGKPVVFDVSASCHSKDLHAFAIFDSSKENFKVKISKAHKGHFNLSFDPKQPGLYFLHLQLKGKEIEGSPYHIRYMEPPDASKVKVVMIPSNVAYVNEVIVFNVDATEAGNGKLVMRAVTRKQDKQEAPQFNVVDNKDGTFTAQCTAFVPAKYTFDVLWSDTPVPNSPFTLAVVPQPPEINHLLSHNLNVVEIGRSLDIYFNLTDDSDKDSIKGLAIGAEYGEAEVKVQFLEDLQYRAHFHASVVDEYSMEVMFKGQPLESSPFPIKVVPLGALEPHSEVENPCYVEAGKKVNLLPSTTVSDPNANLQVNIEGPPHTEVLPVVKRNLKYGQFAVEFMPERPGDYLVHVKTDDVPVNGSPFRITAKAYKSDATKCVIMEADKELFTKYLRFGKPCQFRISTANAGPGVLNITSRGPAKAEVKIFDNEDGTYTCDFLPTVPGRYAVDILWDEQHIPGSPYELKFKEKKRRMVTGLNLDEENFKVNVPHRFKLHTADIGEGILEVRCHPPSAAQIKLSMVGGSTYQIEILPKVVGRHEVIVMYNGNHLLGSPFTVTFGEKGDASKCTLLKSDVEHVDDDHEHVVFIIGTKDAGNGELTAYVENQSTSERQHVDIDPLEDSQYKIHFDLGESSEYNLTVKFDGQHIEGSPFKLLFQEQGETSLCTAEGDGLTSSQVGKVATFDVLSEGEGLGNVRVTIEGDNGFIIDPKIEVIGESTHRVTYVPSSPGQYAIAVYYGDNPIQNSPFSMRCYHPAKSSDVFVISPPAEGYIESPIEFEIDASKVEQNGELSVIAFSKKHEFVGKVVESKGRLFQCSMNIDSPGKYLVKVLWNGEHVTESPFKLKVAECPKPEKVKAYGPGLIDGYVGQEGNFTLETADAGSGTLAVRVHGPRKGYQINMRRHPDNDRTILVRYDPKYAGAYTVDITWSEVHVPGSPFKVMIQEQLGKGLFNGEVEKADVEIP